MDKHPHLIPLVFMCAGLCTSLCATMAQAMAGEMQDAESGSAPADAGFYSSPDEEREGGPRTQLAPWLAFSGLLEAEKEYTQHRIGPNQYVAESSHPVQTLQLAFEMEHADWLEAEFIFEAENDKQLRSRLDEGWVGVTYHDAGVKAGKLYLPFGEFFSHFVSGPALEFAETRADSLLLEYETGTGLNFTAFVFDGQVETISGAASHDWGYRVEWASAGNHIRIGASYLSDILESEEPLVEAEDYPVARRISAYTAYGRVGIGGLDFTLEALGANDDIAELDSAMNRPFSVNFEMAYFTARILYAVRIEHNRELEDTPQRRYGVTASFLIVENLTLSLDYLYGDFEEGFASIDEQDVQVRNEVAGNIAFGF